MFGFDTSTVSLQICSCMFLWRIYFYDSIIIYLLFYEVVFAKIHSSPLFNFKPIREILLKLHNQMMTTDQICVSRKTTPQAFFGL